MTVLLSSTCAHLNINGILSLLLNKVSNIFPNIFISRFQNKPTNLPNLMYQSYTIHSDNLNRTSNFHLRQSFALQTCNLQYSKKKKRSKTCSTVNWKSFSALLFRHILVAFFSPHNEKLFCNVILADFFFHPLPIYLCLCFTHFTVPHKI